MVEHGDRAHQLVGTARRHGAAVIVTGRRGYGDLKRMLPRGVSHEVRQPADCACLTVE